MDDPGFDVRQGQKYFLPHQVQTGSGPHTASYSIGPQKLFLWGKTALA